MRRKIAAGNWKMNGSSAALSELDALARLLPTERHADVVICPPAQLLSQAVSTAKPHSIHIGAQDCHMQTAGAFTGDISAPMIADTGATYVITGHSERRAAHHEADADVRAKTQSAQAAGLTAILCIGETLAHRQANRTLEIIADQLAGSLPDDVTADSLIIAYEPIWAIGTGEVATLPQITEVHDFIRGQLTTRFGEATGNSIPLLYGGSVKPDNAATIFEAENVDGALVGGASLKASDFAPIIAALAAS
ncbi:Triosephosphate isomerase [Sulfitobacter noctilucae]|uniref:triose-phosphate isomerase n=1 Tax=Sulfitobacter noctilucae TaxID=1342302 RepID=UPI0004698BD8|nr:triose-phosphate isomerase [Sulfitobacter noctilucae]KIN60822.1 Triosephosphate isomerase [Sulfitobacter noctilucae]